MESIHITLKDGAVLEVPRGSTAADVAKKISPRLASAALVARVSNGAPGELVDLSRPLDHDSKLEILTEKDPEALQVFRGSFPLEYPEIETLVVLQRRRFRFLEIPYKMLPRTTGRSSITAIKSIYYIVHVLLGVLVNVLKYERGRKIPEGN